MPIVYKLINPVNHLPYYVGYTAKSTSERLLGHCNIPVHRSTIELLNIDLLPVIEVIDEGEHVTKATEMYWIKKLSQSHALENIDGLVNYQERKNFFDLPKEIQNEINLSIEDRYRIAIELLLKEIPLSSSVPIMIRIKNLLDWASGNIPAKSL